jgi:peptidoglycan/LPS O-acetylase OafA/YrhL
MVLTSADSPARIHAIDWLRVLTVLVIFLFHVLHIFDFDPAASIKNGETSLAASVFVFFSLQWSVQLLFLLAGSSHWFSLRSRSRRAYLGERVRRLLIPFVFGSVMLIPWIGYVSALNHGTFDGPFWRFVPVHFERTWTSLQSPQIHHGLIAFYYTSWHLWFLAYLFLFAIGSCVLFSRDVRAAGLAAWSGRPMGLLLLVVPIAIVKVAVGPAFPAYLDWADTLVFLILFSYGWLFMTDARFLRAVEHQALLWLTIGAATFALLLASYALGYLPRWMAHPSYAPDYLLYQGLAALNTWAWILAILGCGLRWLEHDNATLRYLGPAALPIYILHQVPVAIIGAIVVTCHTSVTVKGMAIATGSFIATMAIYEWLVRRHTLLRSLFGLRTDHRLEFETRKRRCVTNTEVWR